MDNTDITESPAEGDHLTFEDLGVPPLPREGPGRPGHHRALRHPARSRIADALAGRDVCGKAKTGSGKTLAFGLPMLERLERAEPRKPRGLVLVPTRELALQVHDVLAPLAEAIGSRVVAVYGGADMNKQIKALAAGVEAIIATPGRLIDLVDRKEVELGGLELVVVDEADRMADMGFLPQVEWLLRHVDTRHQTLLFSATLDGVVDGLIKRYQHDPVYHEVASPTVTVDAHGPPLHRRPRDGQGEGRGGHRPRQRHAPWRSRTPSASPTAWPRALNEEGVRAAAIHGDLRQGQREDALRKFGEGKLQVLVATDVAARGLAHRRHRRRDPLRAGAGAQDLPPPLRPHGPGRFEGPGREPVDLERGAAHEAPPEAHRRRCSRSSRCSRTTPASTTSPPSAP